MATNNAINQKDSGIVTYDGAGIYAGRVLVPPAAGIDINNPGGVSGNPTFSLDDDLAAVEGLSGTGLATRTATSTWTTRTITAGTGISISNGDGVSGNPTISATAAVPTTFTEDSGSATPALNNLNILGTAAQGISTSGTGSTVTITAANATSTQKGVASFNATNFTANTGNITSNNITFTAGTGLTGGGSATLGGNVSFALSTPVTVANGGTGRSTLTSNAVLYGLGTSNVGLTNTGSDGQLLIGATGAAPAFATVTGMGGITLTPGVNNLTISNVNIPNSALQNSSITLTAGTGISISVSPVSLGGSTTISAKGAGGLTWNDQSGSFTATSGNGYFLTAASTPTLPASPSQGDQIAFDCDTASTVTLTANTGQRIRLGNTQTALAGTCASQTIGNSITLYYRASNATWHATASVGIWGLT